MKILFITTHNLASNPRLVKEIQLALDHKFVVEVICFEFNNWSSSMNEAIKARFHAAKITSIPAGRENGLAWLQSVLLESIYRWVGRFFPLSLPALSQAVSRRSRLLANEVDNHAGADWVIGHNPGALWPAYKASVKMNCRCGFDVEDYHPGEGVDRQLSRLVRKLMCTILPRLRYVSFAAPLIMEAVQHDTGVNRPDWFTVLNYFPAQEFITPAEKSNGPLKMVWFSQNITKGRGLELIIDYFNKSKPNAELHLIGHIEAAYQLELTQGFNIFIHAPVDQATLHRELANYDIGLALDLPVDGNRELAITNKCLAYLQAGLYVIATDIRSHRELMRNFPDHGACVSIESDAATTRDLDLILTTENVIRSMHHSRYQQFGQHNWENTSVRLLQTWTS